MNTMTKKRLLKEIDARIKLKDKVCNLASAKKLKDLEIKQDSKYCWAAYSDGTGDMYPAVDTIEEFNKTPDHQKMFIASAFTADELSRMLIKAIKIKK